MILKGSPVESHRVNSIISERSPPLYCTLTLHGSTPSDRRTFGVDRLVWTEAARKGGGAPWYTGVLLGAERFMASWHKSEEEASKLREVNRAA